MPKKITKAKLYRRVGKNLTYLIRESAMTTPAAVSREIGVHKSKVHYAVTGRYCSLELATALANRLGTSLDNLVKQQLWK